jgi:hypothetical protein
VLTESLIVFTTPRSGSTLLCDWLRAFLPGHYHGLEPDRNDKLKLLTTSTGKFWTKENYEKLSTYEKLLIIEKYRPFVVKVFPYDAALCNLMTTRKVILLNRKDIKKQTLSHAIAAKTNKFNGASTNTISDLMLSKEEFFQVIFKQLASVRDFDNMKSRISSQVILELNYEDFENDLNNLFVALQPVLGLTEEHRKLIPNNYVKQNINHESKIANIELFNDLWEKHKHISGRY